MALLPSFKNPKLRELAFTHRSYLNETSDKDIPSNERLEFLGDSILAFLVSDFLYKKFPSLPEGKLTNLRSFLVKTGTLAATAEELQLGKYLKLSKGEEQAGRNNITLLANTFEALIGALFLDSGIEKVHKFIKKVLFPKIDNDSVLMQLKDNKSLFQELIQQDKKPTPTYKILETQGPDHKKIFTVGVYVFDVLWGVGKGNSKQEAEQEAAKIALEKHKNR